MTALSDLAEAVAAFRKAEGGCFDDPPWTEIDALANEAEEAVKAFPVKVWVVTYTDDDDETHIAAVCDNEATARKYPSTIYSVEEYEVQS